MAAQAARASLVHSMKGRARLRFPEQQGTAGFFDSLATALARTSAVSQVRASAETGSLLLLHTGELSAILSQAQKLGLFEVAPPPSKPSIRLVRDVIEAADDRVAKRTGDTFSVGKLVFLAMVGASVFQAKNGHFLPAGVTLLKNALEVMDWVIGREPVNSPS